MKIEKDKTPDYSSYEVYLQEEVEVELTPKFWWFKAETETRLRETRLEGVIEADDQTGLVVRQYYTDDGHPLYTNELEDMALNDTVRLLLLLPAIRQAFMQAGFHPKVFSVYYPGKIKIVSKAVGVQTTRAAEAAA